MESEYYPQRARWYSRFLYPCFALRRGLHLETIHLPSDLSTLQFFLSLIAPGYAFFVNGRWVLGWVFLGTYFVSAIVFVVALGYQIGGIGYGLMISAHATSIIFLEGHWLRERCEFGYRLMLAVVTLLAVWQAVYAPAVDFVERHWVMPLRVRGNVVIVHQSASAQAVRRGERVLYTMRESQAGNAHENGGAVLVRAGFGWGPVLAVAGDRVEFSTNSFSVNGVSRPLLPHMPQGGEFVLPEKHWFIWPELDINGHGNASEATISTMMSELAVVPEDQFIGKPFQRWFGRRQILP
jgi:hypothetical protein